MKSFSHRARFTILSSSGERVRQNERWRGTEYMRLLNRRINAANIEELRASRLWG